MYNRYIPQSDGSYQRSRMPDKAREQRRPPERRPQERSPQPCRPPQQLPSPVCPPPPCRDRRPEPPAPTGIGKFLKNLLPKDFDTEDLLVILMFLLMSRDQEDQNSALLTLALYLFM